MRSPESPDPGSHGERRPRSLIAQAWGCLGFWSPESRRASTLRAEPPQVPTSTCESEASASPSSYGAGAVPLGRSQRR